MFDLSLVNTCLEIGIGLLLAWHNWIINKQKEILSEIKEDLRGDFQSLEERVDILLGKFDHDIKETTAINYKISQSLTIVKKDIKENLVRVDSVLQDLKSINVDLLIASRLARKKAEVERDEE